MKPFIPLLHAVGVVWGSLLVGCETAPPRGSRIEEAGYIGSNGFSVRNAAKLIRVNEAQWKPAHPAKGFQVLIAPHWECEIELRKETAGATLKSQGITTGFIWVESDADRKSKRYSHGPDGPFANAAHQMEGLKRDLEFPWGRATSLVTWWANGRTGLRTNNWDLNYVIKGRTRDGRWWVNGNFPIAHPKLPKGWDDPRAKSNNDLRDSENDGIRISRFAPESFAPPMSVYDSIVGSLTFPK